MAKFDIEKTQELAELFQIGRGERDKNWNKKFFAAVADASLMCGQPQVEIGPDQLPYFHLVMPNGSFEPFCITHILDAALQNTFGVCVFSDMQNSKFPEFVFSYGDLLSYKLYSSFEGDPADVTIPQAPGPGLIKEVVNEARQVLVGQPNEEYFPEVARKALGNFIVQQMGFPDPKICLIMDPQLQPSRNIAINIGIDDVGGNEEQLRDIFRYISWFLPRNYGLMSVPDIIDESALAALR